MTAPPSAMGCTPATSPTGSGTDILFGLDSAGLTAADRATLSAIAAGWHSGGGHDVLRIDGFASCDGAARHNWLLSCRRAQAVATELETPSDGSPGIPATNLEVLASGETDRFDARTLPPNRRVVITAGGTPPPGPTCGITITGPNQVDRYCAAYVPSDAASCGVFPAPNITLTGAGGAPGSTLSWRITRGASRASIVGATTGASVTIKGDAQSVTAGDVTVQATDGRCTTTHALTVRQPTSMPSTVVRTTTAAFVQAIVTYTVQDQFGIAMGANICWDETVTVCANSHPGGTTSFGDVGTNASGQVVDRLQVGGATGTLPAGLCVKLNQSITAGGCGPLVQQTVVFRPSPIGVTINAGASCVVGASCP